MSSTEVAVATSTAPAISNTMDFNTMIRVSEMLSRSSLVPSAYRGKPENILLASLAGQSFGWDPTMAMRSFHVIEGQPSLKPEIMLALVRRAGHSVSGDTSPTGATITGTRRDTGDTMTVTYTLDDARRANLANKSVWKQYPQSMCWARALSQLCRMLFPDVVLGAGYVPEELGATVNADGEVIEATVVSLPADHIAAADAKKELIALCDGDIERAKTIWGDRGSAPIHADELGELFKQAAVEDAEVVEAAAAGEEEDDIYEILPKPAPGHKPSPIVEEGCDY